MGGRQEKNEGHYVFNDLISLFLANYQKLKPKNIYYYSLRVRSPF